jgi:hypothetical protein
MGTQYSVSYNTDHITPYKEPVFYAAQPGCVMVTNVPIRKKNGSRVFSSIYVKHTLVVFQLAIIDSAN